MFLLRTAVPQTRGRVVDQTVNRRPFNSEAPFRIKPSPCGICHRRSGSGTVSLSEPILHFHILFIYRRCCVVLAVYSIVKYGYEAGETSVLGFSVPLI